MAERLFWRGNTNWLDKGACMSFDRWLDAATSCSWIGCLTNRWLLLTLLRFHLSFLHWRHRRRRLVLDGFRFAFYFQIVCPSLIQSWLRLVHDRAGLFWLLSKFNRNGVDWAGLNSVAVSPCWKWWPDRTLLVVAYWLIEVSFIVDVRILLHLLSNFLLTTFSAFPAFFRGLISTRLWAEIQ